MAAYQPVESGRCECNRVMREGSSQQTFLWRPYVRRPERPKGARFERTW